jgi:uncharacterized protein
MRAVAVDSFVPMLTSLSEILDKGGAFARDREIDLANCRLAPDMYTLAQQVQQACHHARNGMSRLAGRPPAGTGEVEATLAGLKTQIAGTIDFVRSVPDAEFEGAEMRDCSIEIANGLVIEMDGRRFLKSWALPHFYFHVVTAYDILRHVGADIGKRDYLSQVGDFIRPKAA